MKRYCNRMPLKLLLALAAVLILSACTDPAPTGDMALGQEPYLRWCASCHGNEGQGRPPAFPPIAGSEWLDLPDDGLALIILYGLRGEIEVAGRTYRGFMPPMQHLLDEDIADVIAFMLDSWGDRQAMIDSARVHELRGAFEGRRPPLDGWDGVQDAIQAVQP
ncbi:MAG: c-type cytochrome [Wenzhouxiangella sp.]